MKQGMDRIHEEVAGFHYILDKLGKEIGVRAAFQALTGMSIQSETIPSALGRQVFMIWYEKVLDGRFFSRS